MAQTKTVSTLERARDAFVDIRDALENKTGESLDEIPVEQYDDIIEAIPSGEPVLDTLNVTPSTNEQTIIPEQGIDGFNSVYVDAVDNSIDSNIVAGNIKKDVEILGVTGTFEGGVTPSLQDKTITPSTSQQVISADAGYDGLDEVTVEAVDNSIDQNIVASNIKKDVSILGVTGTYEGSGANLQTKSLTPDFSNGNVVVEPDQGYDGIDEITITKDADLVAGNIKKDVDLFGIVGSYEGSGGGGITFTSLAYFFYNNSRKPADYWQSVVEANVENCINFEHMCDGSVFDSGTYPVDLTGIVDNTKIQYMFEGASANGVANIKVKLGSTISSLQYFCKLSTSMFDISKYFNFEFLDGGTYSQVVNLYQAFRGLFGTLDLTKIKGNHFTNLLNAFQQVSIVNDFVGIEDFDITGVTSIKEMFKQFDSAIFDFTNVLFNTLDLSGWDFSRIINMESLLNDSRIPYVKFNGNHIFNGINMNNMFYNSKIEEVRGLEIQDSQYSSNGIASQMFYNCTELKSVISAAKWVLCNGANGMFYNCSKLVTIPAIDLHIEYSYNNKNNANTMFQNCALLEEVTINIINASAILLQCNDMFRGCSSLKEIKGNLDLTKIYQANNITNMFNGCTALEKIATSGEIGNNINQALTLDLSASAVFDISDFISNLAAKTVNQTRSIKLHSAVYSGLSQATIDAATAKGYTLISA